MKYWLLCTYVTCKMFSNCARDSVKVNESHFFIEITWNQYSSLPICWTHTCTSRWSSGGGQNFWPSGGGENFFANLGGGDGFFDPKGGVKRTLLRGELKIVQQRGAKSPPGRTLNRGVQMKKNFVGGGQKNFSYGVLSSCACMFPTKIRTSKRTQSN